MKRIVFHTESTWLKRFRKPLERQVWEGVEIHAGIPMNSKLDHYQPAVGRMMMRNSLDDL